MTNIEALKTLLERVEAGDRPAFLDGIAAAAFPYSEFVDAIEAYGGSLDAALALHNAVLPGRSWIVEAHGGYSVDIWGGGSPDDDFRLASAVSETPARAWLIAILKAKIAELEE